MPSRTGGIMKKEPAEVGTLARKVQETVYASDPDFGNYDTPRRIDAVKRVLSSWNDNFSLYDKKQQDQAAKELLEQMHEKSTYGVAEAVYDIAAPAIGGAIGAPGGLLTGAAGAGVGATIGEMGKAEFERSRRGIPTQTGKAASDLQEGQPADALQEAYNLLAAHGDTGVWEAGSQILGSPVGAGIGRLVRRGARPIARKALLPKTAPPGPVQAAQDVLSREGRSLTAGQLNAHEKNFTYFLEGVASGSAFGGRLKNLYRENFNIVQDRYKNFVGQVSNTMEPSEWGKLVGAAYNEELSLVKIFRDHYHQTAREGLTRLSNSVDMPAVDIGPFIDWCADEAGKKGRPDALRVVSAVNDFLGLKSLSDFKPGGDIAQATYLIQQELQGAPRKLSPIQAADLLQRLNSLYDNKNTQGASTYAADLVRDSLVPVLKQAEKADPKFAGVADNYINANKFHRVTAQRLQDGILPDMMNTLKEKPTALSSFVHGGGAPYDSLIALKRTYLSEKELAPRVHPRTGQHLAPQGAAGKAPLRKYESDILQPLRYDIAQKAYVTQGVEPHFSGDALMSKLTSLGMHLDPQKGLQPGEYLTEVFTDAVTRKNYFPEVLEFANALKGAATTGSGDTVFVKFAQAGVGVQAMSGQTAPGFKTRVAALFIGPIALSKILSDPVLLSNTAKAIKEGPKSTVWHRTISTIARLQAKSATEKYKMGKEKQDFYADKPTQQSKAPWSIGLGGSR
jgi:hypothetical protein